MAFVLSSCRITLENLLYLSKEPERGVSKYDPTQKIIALIAFMLLVTLIVFTWFISQLFCHTKDFKETAIQKRTQLQTRMEKNR